MGLEIIEVIAKQSLEIKFNHVTALNNNNKKSCPRVRTRMNKIQRFSSTFRELRLWRDIFLPTVAVKFGHCPSSCCCHWALDIPLRSLHTRGLQSHILLSLRYIQSDDVIPILISGLNFSIISSGTLPLIWVYLCFV